jgi:DNA adenine methylase
MQLLNVAGAKARIAPWIVSHFPPHKIYVEPFGGSGAVLIAKPESKMEVFNDRAGGLVHFFQVLAAEPANLIKRVDGLLYSAFRDSRPTTDPVEIAARFFLHNNTTWPAANGNSFRRQKCPDKNDKTGRSVAVIFQKRKTLLAQTAARLRHVIFENGDALEVIKRYDGPEVLFYVDPPYYGERRANLYRHEMMDEASHRALATALHECRGAVVLSGYASALYSELYGDWAIVARSCQTNAKDMRVECLWIKAPHTVPIRNDFRPNRRTYWGKIVATAKPLKKSGGQIGKRRAKNNHVINTHGYKQLGGNKYLMARLKRDHPEIVQRLANGEFRSVRAAAKAAGIDWVARIQPKPMVRLRYYWRKVSADQRRAFLAEIGAELKT